ncbi:hypothetical protein A9K75_06510 [Campylobacter fetus subsp. testudinum]|uniref:hypothetical protein n=1 Tax=Campylobacter fetus TaxID=196 RepID=UPI000818B6B3|nr:hypothetical protein [Campylobacter fetus]OCR99517.1 hypothetical protein A9K75_06510 [Campylobacter fetus subsp. testudinum]
MVSQFLQNTNINQYCNTMDIRPSIVINTIADLLSEELQTSIFVKNEDNNIEFFRLNKDGNISKVGPKRFSKICSKFEKEISRFVVKDKKPKIEEIINCKIKKIEPCKIILSFLNYSIIVRKEQLPLLPTSYIVGDSLTVKVSRIEKNKIYANRLDKDIIASILQLIIPSHIKFSIYVSKKDDKKLIYLNVMPPYIGKLEIEILKKLDFKFIIKKSNKKE